MKITIQSTNETLEIDQGLSGKEVAKQCHLTMPHQALALVKNGVVCDLCTPLQEGDCIDFLSFDQAKGREIFWHSSAHVLAQAVLRLFPDAQPTIGPSIQEGFYYDFANLTLEEKDLEQIEKEAKAIIKENHLPERRCFADKREALAQFSSNPFKRELIEEMTEEISAYTQGEFTDLCRGPHLPQLGKIRAFKLLKMSGAYWRGNSANTQLQRIYGISFPDRQQLQEYLHHLEEAKKRDHKRLGPQLQLFATREEAPGMPFILPGGLRVWDALMDFWRECHHKAGYCEIKTPTMMSRSLWEHSGHWENYRENMYSLSIEERDFAIKPMNCPGCLIYYGMQQHSYREFPIKIAEIGQVFRHELSGSLSGLMRVRSFHQDDAHIFMLPHQIEDEVVNVLTLLDHIYSTFGLSYRLELSTRPEGKTIGSDREWEQTTSALQSALNRWGQEYRLNEGDGAFYGPKIDAHICDSIKRTWQCGTIQLDMSLPKRFDLAYTNSKGEKEVPIMIHRALYGSIERFFGILIEHFAGKFPLWLSPLPIRILSVADRHVPFAKKVQQQCERAGFICDLDASAHSVSKKVREAQLEKINYMITIGDSEIESQTLAVRTRNNRVIKSIPLNTFLQEIGKEKAERLLSSPYDQPIT